ncbi:hypothetical protein P1J78_24035 [Psychromarinibacter sp. C21-152]|uniref:Uncharacterized protein n=1 Tax=Psychromarinibacter sediminicola TaxID=3033385 RepID=A0AAE3TCB4_9RHOB|nr:hypothetical protein [Psychromarinibacter sediminicola]MDF0603789.1 hypothetical protein [Psychromarinibacter sediminicola]
MRFHLVTLGLVLGLAAVLSGCTRFPELDAAITPEARRAGYPDLVPITEVLDRRDLARTTAREGEIVEARAAALRARARLLRGIAINDDTRLRLTPRLRRLGG